MDLWKIEWEGVDWMHLAQDRVQWRAVVNTITNLWVQEKVGEFLDWVIVSFSRRTLPYGVSSVVKRGLH
jgi:hypothetical protein